MHRVNVYRDVVAENRATQFEQLDRQMARARWRHDLWVMSLGGMIGVVVMVCVWWFS